MSEEIGRKEPPKIKDEVDRVLDTPVGQGSQQRSPKVSTRAPAIAPTQPEPQTFSERLDLTKLQFGQKLIGWCIFLIVALSMIGYFFEGADPNSNELGVAIELLKLVTTTALGFVFAKTQVAAEQAKKQKDD